MTWRLGSVPYLNAEPLLYGLRQANNVSLEFAVPSELAIRLRDNRFDAALVPAVHWWDAPHCARVPELCIGCDGAVWSVLLFFAKEPRDVRVIGLDRASRSSRLLTQIIWKRKAARPVEFIDVEIGENGPSAPCDAFLAIGDIALQWRERGPLPHWDLGECWRDLTGLPFVFALWLAPRGPLPTAAEALLRASRDAGRRAIDDIAGAADLPGVSRDTRAAYLRDRIHYELTPRHEAGFRRFEEWARLDGLIGDAPPCH